MQTLKFKVGDIITISDPGDENYLKSFYEVVGTLPVEKNQIPYTIRSLKLGTIYSVVQMTQFCQELICYEKKRLFAWRTVAVDLSSPKAYFETTYRTITDNEKVIYINE